MDDLDRAIRVQLGADARTSVAVLSRRLKVDRSTIQARLGSGCIDFQFAA